MILPTQSIPSIQPWQLALRHAITEPEVLWEQLQLPDDWLVGAKRACVQFPLRVPQGFVDRMQKGNVDDPLLRQVLPLDAETKSVAGFVVDPLKEQNANPVAGLLHKYHGRVLLTVTGSCAVHCRYCFRRHFPYEDNNPGKAGWEAVWDYIQRNTDITEVILSGGDPLMAPDRVLSNIIQKIETIEHVKTIRLHTRLPIVLPERITLALTKLFIDSRLHCVCVVHCNHAQEINALVCKALARLKEAGFTLLNQSVLLQGVNDNANTLIKLSHALFAQHVLPYYLHQLDKVAGSHHFFVSPDKAYSIVQACRAQLPGYLVPRYVTEIAGELNKTPLIMA